MMIIIIYNNNGSDNKNSDDKNKVKNTVPTNNSNLQGKSQIKFLGNSG